MTEVQGLEFDSDSLTQDDLVADRRWASACTAINVQADIDPSARDAIRRLQRALSLDLPPQHPIPESALHASVLNLIHSRSDETDDAKERAWRSVQDSWRRGIADAAAATPPFELRLSEVVVTPAGIIVAARACAEMIELRRRLIKACELTSDLPRLCHVTVFRFGPTTPSLGALRDTVSRLQIDVTVPITTIRLVRELVYPSLERHTIQEAALRGGLQR